MIKEMNSVVMVLFQHPQLLIISNIPHRMTPSLLISIISLIISTHIRQYIYICSVHHYTDDIEFFDFKTSGSDVVVGAGSRSEPNSFYDYGMFKFVS